MKGLVITTENKMQVREFGEPAYGNLAGIPAVKAAGSLTTVLSSGLVAVIASRKAVRA